MISVSHQVFSVGAALAHKVVTVEIDDGLCTSGATALASVPFSEPVKGR